MIIAAASAALLLGSSVAGAETLMGRVVAKDVTANTLTIQTDAGQEVVLQTRGAAIRAEGADVNLDRVQVGDRVRVEADDATAGAGAQRAATDVEVTTAAAATAPDTGAMPETADRPQTGDMPETADVDDPDMDRRAASDDQRMARLPDTAGPLPLIGLAGAAALLAGLALRRMR
jgi:hypothetical protein